MQKFFQVGYAFFLVAAIFLVVSALTGKFAVYLSLGVVFFILGLAVRKKNSQKTSEPTPKT
jgi:membrane-bound ClpP family serine protease